MLPRQSDLIRWLLDPDPAKRPTARELLHHDLMPVQLENEDVLLALRQVRSCRPFQTGGLRRGHGEAVSFA